MSKKHTQKELEQRINDLERIFNFSLDMIGVGNLAGYFIKINSSFGRILGYSDEEFKAVPFLKFVHRDDCKDTEKALHAALDGQKEIFIENRYKCKDGTYKWIDWKVLALVEEDRFFAVGRDITSRKQTEKDLMRQKMNLEETNLALKIILRESEVTKKEIEDNILTNIKKLLLPYLVELESRELREDQKFLLDIIKTNINEIGASFSKTLNRTYRELTPREIQVADLVKQGRTNKEIAKLLNISPNSVDFHRRNLRVKLNIKGKKINLRSQLLSSVGKDYE